jgi:hypothetical protein
MSGCVPRNFYASPIHITNEKGELNLPGCRELEGFASSGACWHLQNTDLKDSSSLVVAAVTAHRVIAHNFRRRKLEGSMDTTVRVRIRKDVGYRQENAMAEHKASDEVEWSLPWTACEHGSGRPAGLAAMANCTPTDLSGRSSKVAG